MISPLDNWTSKKLGKSPLTRDLLGEYTEQKLRENVSYAALHSRFYRKHFSGFEGIDTLVDFKRLPFTMPDDISKDAGAFLCVPPHEISRIVTLHTSGSTGKSKRLFFTSEDQELTIDFFHHGMSTFTSSGDNVLIFLPGTTIGGVCDLLVRGLSRLGAAGEIYGGIKDYDHAGQTLSELSPDVIVGMPQQIYRLAEMTTAFKCKSVLLASDYISAETLDRIEKTWNCEVFSHYGLTESGLGGAVSCSAHMGYHMREADLYFEIIEPATGETLPDGEYGEVVFTSLTRRGMPLIRYRTGDRSRILSERCLCGSVIRRFDNIADRGIRKPWS